VAVPKRRKSKSKSRMRRAANQSLSLPNIRPCPRCGAHVLPHRVCPECMHYKGELILEKKVKITEA
jgi:large subunit ribosomal protein L32